MTNERTPQQPSAQVSVEQPAAQAPDAAAPAPVLASSAPVEIGLEASAGAPVPPAESVGEAIIAPPAPPLPDATIDRVQIEAICGGYHGSPFDALGPHVVTVKGKEVFVVRAFRPLDAEVFVIEIATGKRTPMEKVHPAGFFEAVFARRKTAFPYRLIVDDAAHEEFELEDPFRFTDWLLTDYDIYLHGEGNFFDSYTKFGAHFRVLDGVKGVNFALWAPNALRVSVIGEFNAWDDRVDVMQQRGSSGLWEIFIPNLPEGAHYKYSIKSRVMGYQVDKADPYGFFNEVRPTKDSRVWDIDKYVWGDDTWVAERVERQALDKPINVLEVHLGSWKRVPETNDFLSYHDLAHDLVAYAKDVGYTHLELLPITEHPFDGSWGYQVTGYYAPTSRFGTPDDFMYFVDYCHQNGIGVILDWVPAHFPKDAHGLAFFDGTHVYEHSDPRQGEHKDWGTKIFNYGRNEVRNFLLSNAIFWCKKYHLDGLRVDAVASMLYLDYSREAGEWVPNKYGGRENLEAIDFVRRFNELVHQDAPGVLTIAEESTSWPMVTRPTYTGGLGFDLKWNMGWMHDTLSYMQKDPIYRRYHQNQVTFSLIYAFHENFILPFSHDEVVHLKRSMLDKMPGDVWQKFANLRALYAYMYGHPGKKLLFMGCDFGQWAEWSEARSLDWNLLEWEDHRQLLSFVRDISGLYRNEPALYEIDSSWEGFQWIDFADADSSIISFLRRAKDPADILIYVCNFTPQSRPGYRIGLPVGGYYREILNSDWTRYGGSGVDNAGGVNAETLPWQSCKFSAPVNVPPLGVVVLKPQRDL